LIPFSDLVAQFEDSPNTESIVLFGLSYENEADLLLWGLNSPNGRKLIIGDPYDSPVENLVCPVPPFGSEEMGLLQ